MDQPVSRSSLCAPLSRREWLGLAVAVAFMAWATFAGILHGLTLSPGSPFLYAPVCLALGVIAGRWITRRWSLQAQVVGLITAVTWVMLVLGTAGAAAPPLGYANANAALANQILAIAGLIALRATGSLRAIVLIVGATVAAVPLLSLSKAGVAVGTPVLLAIALALTGRVRRRWWSIAATSTALVVAAVLVVFLASRATWPAVANAMFSSARHELWSDALSLWSQRPVLGSGPGSFQRFAPLAADPDTATAHSSVLQVAAETGLVGAALFALLVAAGYVMSARGSAARCLIATAAWTALGIHSFGDHLLEFPAVIGAAGLVLGLGASKEFDISQRQRPLAGIGR